ncbi:MAG: hypothetical protein ACFFAI_05090 [Promethearchaeota archaeon]
MIISIDWEKAEAKPEKKMSVEGGFLLDLRAKVNDLEKQLSETKTELSQTQDKLANTQNELADTKISLDDTKSTLNDTQNTLEKTIGDGQRKDQTIEALTAEKEAISKDLEEHKTKVSDLEEIIAELETSTEKVVDLETQLNEANSTISANQSEIEDLTSKLSEMDKLNAQLGELNNTLLQRDTQIQELTDALGEKEQALESTSAHLSEVESELEELKPPDIGSGGFAADERITCPMCGAVGHDIKTVEDKGKVLSYVGHIPMYAKKNVCKKCGYEF